MSDVIIPGTFEVGISYIKLEKADGRVIYYKLEGGVQTEITEIEYNEANKDTQSAKEGK